MKPRFYDPDNVVRRSRRSNLEIKAIEGGKRYIVGYAATFETPDKYDSYGDIIHKNAFDDVIEAFNAGDLKIKMLSQHNDHEPIGLWEVLKADDVGLWVEGEIAKTRAGDDMVELVNKEIVDSLSVGLIDILYRDLEEKTEWGWPVQEITKTGLIEVSPVTFPANEYAKIMEVRSKRKAANKDTSFEEAADAVFWTDASLDLDSLIKSFDTLGAVLDSAL